MSLVMTSTIVNSIVNFSTPCYGRSLNQLDSIWLPLRLSAAQMVIIVEQSSCLVHTLQITQSNAYSQALFKAGAQDTYVTICYIDTPLTICFRYNVPSKNIDCGRLIQHSEAHTELLCKNCEMTELWDNYGIVDDIKVIFIYVLSYLRYIH